MTLSLYTKIGYYICFSIFFLQGSVLTLHAKPISYEEIISLNKPKQVILSPSVSKIAFSTRQGLLEENKNIDSLYLLDRIKNQQ